MTPFELLPLIAVAAALDSVNPCAFSILFLTIVFLFSIKKDRKYVLKVAGAYIAGIFATYVLIGVGVLQVLSFFNVPNGLAKFGAIALLVFSVLSILDDYVPNFPVKMAIPDFIKTSLAARIERASIPSAVALGVLVGMFEFPCTGGPYLFILSLLHDNATVLAGFGYLVVYNLIFVLPLVLVLLASTSRVVAERVDRLRRHGTRRTRLAVNLSMVVLALIILFV